MPRSPSFGRSRPFQHERPSCKGWPFRLRPTGRAASHPRRPTSRVFHPDAIQHHPIRMPIPHHFPVPFPAWVPEPRSGPDLAVPVREPRKPLQPRIHALPAQWGAPAAQAGCPCSRTPLPRIPRAARSARSLPAPRPWVPRPPILRPSTSKPRFNTRRLHPRPWGRPHLPGAHRIASGWHPPGPCCAAP